MSDEPAVTKHDDGGGPNVPMDGSVKVVPMASAPVIPDDGIIATAKAIVARVMGRTAPEPAPAPYTLADFEHDYDVAHAELQAADAAFAEAATRRTLATTVYNSARLQVEAARQTMEK